jgi:hypothetical protein
MTVKEVEKIKEIEVRMRSVAQEIIDESDARLAALPPNTALEIKAQKIRKNMAEICQAFVKMEFNQKNPLPTRRKILSDYIKIPPDCSDAEITYLHALVRIENTFMAKYSQELGTAKQFYDDENIFKLETQIGVIKHITEKWREFGRTEGFTDEY